jgi:hypothetical protein
MPRADAADLIRHMADQEWLPDARRRVDSLALWPAVAATTLKDTYP